MKSAWIDRDAQATVDRYARDGVGTDIALRVYTTRLLGRDPKLVLHGGGNTSVKLVDRNLFGEDEEILYVKGSGWDLETIEARPVIRDGKVVDLQQPKRNNARLLIEDFMIAANGTTARFLARHKLPSIRRVVRSPERWDRIERIAE